VRIVAIILSVICLIYVGARLVDDLGNYYFDTTGFYLLLCLCFIVNLIALRRSRGRGLVRHYKKEAAREEKTEPPESNSKPK